MPTQVVKQPNGLFALFSTVVDDFTGYNLTSREIVEYKINQGQQRDYVVDNILKINQEIKPHYLSSTWEECLETMVNIHGEKRKEEFFQEFQEDCETLEPEYFKENENFLVSLADNKPLNEVSSVSMVILQPQPGIRLEWGGKTGWGQIDFFFRGDKLVLDDEYTGKEFVKQVFAKLIDDAELDR